MNTPVSFEIAKLIEYKDIKIISNYRHYINEDGKEVTDEFIAKKYNNHIPTSMDAAKSVWATSFVNAPTIAEVVMWLYKNCEIWIECLHRGDMGDFTFKISKLKKIWRTEPHYIHKNGFNSPTEAYEKAIQYTLSNLI